MPVFGLLGKKLEHSFSKSYFEKKFLALRLNDHCYKNFELSDIRSFPVLLEQEPELRGLNVTVPYKQSILPFLDEVDEVARNIGAVNCIRIVNGKTKGFNTDAFGFTESIKPFLNQYHERALILGTGGASKAVAYTLKNLGLPVAFVSSDPAKKQMAFSAMLTSIAM